MRRQALLVAIVACALPARAEWRERVAFQPGVPVSIELRSPFDLAPAAGVLPLRIEVANGGAGSGSWQVVVTASSGPSASRRVLRVEQGMTVAPGEKAAFDLVVPITGGEAFGFGANVQIAVSGPGVEPRLYSIPNEVRSGAAPTAFVGMSEAVARRNWPDLRSALDKQKRRLRGTTVALPLLPADWRAFLSLRALWLADTEYDALSAAQRLALREWILSGGQAIICETAPRADLRAAFDLPGDAVDARVGLGRLRFASWTGDTLPAPELTRSVLALPAEDGASSPDYDDAWPLARRVGALPWNVPLLTVGVLAFALVVGPLNLFWFARTGHRHRLFWTTPLISIVASVALAAFIVVQDGFGGHGARALLVYVDPAARRAVAQQEQISRTGMLLSRWFSIEPGSRLVPLSASAVGRGGRPVNDSIRGDTLGGDWFSTRWRQAQFAQAVRPARGEVRLEEGPTGTALRSSLPVAFEEIYVVAPGGAVWRARDVHPGGRVALHPSNREELTAAIQRFPQGPRLRAALDSRPEPAAGGYFAFGGRGEFLPTLSSIRWDDDHALYFGPLSAP